jgi:hypothetical protein
LEERAGDGNKSKMQLFADSDSAGERATRAMCNFSLIVPSRRSELVMTRITSAMCNFSLIECGLEERAGDEKGNLQLLANRMWLE